MKATIFERARKEVNRVKELIDSTRNDFQPDNLDAKQRQDEADDLIRQAEYKMGDGQYKKAMELSEQAERRWEGN